MPSGEVLASTVGAGGRRLACLVVSGSPAEVSEKGEEIGDAWRRRKASFFIQVKSRGSLQWRNPHLGALLSIKNCFRITSI